MGVQLKTLEQLAQEKLEEFLQDELGEYSFKWIISLEETYNDKVYFNIDLTNHSDSKDSIQMYYDTKEEDLYVCMYEDQYEMVRTFDWHIKYFWMKIQW